ncbi:MAG: tRNA nucleotidyltransferase, partial [Oscillospiraceae bacterium]|nr:tRNA nucleotidyltransferase [Oscillospiraceae bacterium]
MKTDRENTGFIFDTLHDAGHEVYLVGGCVRDLAAGHPVHDYDFTTDALPDEMIRIFGEENIIP